MGKRELSLDVLRGLAIVGMVLSGTISRNVDLPAWLFHAQIPPPDFVFNPDLPGLTWVDLVFPFFLFAMGMAFPFAMIPTIEKGIARKTIIRKIISRSVKLFFFAFFLAHLSPFHYPPESGWVGYLLGIIAFAAFFLAYSRFPVLTRYEKKFRWAAYIILIVLIILRVKYFNLPWSLHRHDIIILVLANMALFGALIWLFTRHNWYLRLGIMAIYFAFRLTFSIDESINKTIWDFTLLKWMGETNPHLYSQLLPWGLDLGKTIFYHPNFLKYLLIVIPGTIAGDMLYAASKTTNVGLINLRPPAFSILSVILLAIVGFNLWGLQGRYTSFVWIINIVTSITLLWLVSTERFKTPDYIKQLISWSIFWLLLGLVFEAFEGGIKKDPATMSYFLIAAGISGLMVVFFILLKPVFSPGKLLGFLGLTGMNPLLGYVAATWFVMPVLYFIQVLPWIDQWHTHWPWAGLLRGLVLTALMILVTVFSVRKGFIWKT